jgi:hypothetical protein
MAREQIDERQISLAVTRRLANCRVKLNFA